MFRQYQNIFVNLKNINITKIQTLFCLVLVEDDGWAVAVSDSTRSRATIVPVKAWEKKILNTNNTL